MDKGFIVLDFGSGNSCKNDTEIVINMIDELKKVTQKKKTDKEIIIKWQLFERCGGNTPLERQVFDFARKYAEYLGFKTTASVFDKDSLDFLLRYDIPFVKLANRRDLDFLIRYVPEDMLILLSTSDKDIWLPEAQDRHIELLLCVSQYPATVEEYEKIGLFTNCNLSDHTDDFTLYLKYKPKIIEWHYKLKNTTGLDSGKFARTPESLEGIL